MDDAYSARSVRAQPRAPERGAALRRGLDRLFVGGVKRLDAFLRRQQGILEYSSAPHCILRINEARSDADVLLQDGILIRGGSPIVELHFWNEKLPLPRPGLDMAWVVRIRRRLIWSFADLAAYLRGRPELSQVAAIHARISLPPRHGVEQARLIAARFGFELRSAARPLPLYRRVHDFWEDLLVWALVRVYGPPRRRSALRRRRFDLWISRSALLARYDSGPAAPIAGQAE